MVTNTRPHPRAVTGVCTKVVIGEYPSRLTGIRLDVVVGALAVAIDIPVDMLVDV